MGFSISCTDKPLYCRQMAPTTGTSMSGSPSAGIRAITTPPRIAIRMAASTDVYGRRNASLTIHILTIADHRIQWRGQAAACRRALAPLPDVNPEIRGDEFHRDVRKIDAENQLQRIRLESLNDRSADLCADDGAHGEN